MSVAETRIRGQEVVIRIARENLVEQTMTAIKDFSFQYDFATISEGYLGETTMRKDDIFNGVSGSFTVDQESQDLLLFQDFLKRRAQRRADVPINQSRVNATVRLSFPNGESPRILIRDMKFGPVPNAAPSRDAYLNASFSYEAEDAKVIPG